MTTRKRPHSDSRFARYLRNRVLELRPKSQIEIASEAGFVNPNVLSMLKNGATKMPLDRVPALARALDDDPVLIFKLSLEQVGGSMTATAIKEIFGTLVTRNEAVWLRELREASDHADPRLTTRNRSAMRAIFGK